MIYELHGGQRLILGSASPRRKELLEQAGIDCVVTPLGVEEHFDEGRTPTEEALFQAAHKSSGFLPAKSDPSEWLLTADTIVALGDKKFGKPEDSRGAAQMLSELSGKTHLVITGVHVSNFHLSVASSIIVESEVRFRDLSEKEIHAYAICGEGLDKAGGYGIQGVAGAFVSAVKGSVSNIIGLPLSETVELLMREKIVAPRRSSE